MNLVDSAASAVRNLNDHEIMNRKLRVDFSNDGAEDEAVSSTSPHARRVQLTPH
jgi:cleavage stimulation factor subunit 2